MSDDIPLVPRALPERLLTPKDLFPHAADPVQAARAAVHAGDLPAPIDFGAGRSDALFWCPDTMALWHAAKSGHHYLLNARQVAMLTQSRNCRLSEESKGKKLPETPHAIYEAHRLRRMPAPIVFPGTRRARRAARKAGARPARWLPNDIATWIQDGEPLCWGPVFLTPEEVIHSARFRPRPKRTKAKKKVNRRTRSQRLKRWEERGFLPDAQSPVPGRPLPLYSRHELESRFRLSLRNDRRLPGEWALPLLLDLADLAVIFSTAKPTLYVWNTKGKLPTAIPLDQKARVPEYRWRRQEVEQLIAEKERESAEAQAQTPRCAFLSPGELAHAFQVTKEQLAASLPPHDSRGYRPDLVMNWLASEKELHRRRDELLAPVALLIRAEASHALRVDTKDLPSVPVVPIIGSIEQWGKPSALGGVPASQRTRKNSFTQKGSSPSARFRLASLVSHAGAPLPDPTDDRARATELAAALRVNPAYLNKAHDAWEYAKKWFRSQGSVSRGPDGYSVQLVAADDFLSLGFSATASAQHTAPTSSAAQNALRAGVAAAWAEVEACLGAFPTVRRRPGANDAPPLYRIDEVAAWLDAMEERERERRGYDEAPATQRAASTIRLVLDFQRYEVIAGIVDGEPIVCSGRVGRARRLLAILSKAGGRMSKAAVTKALDYRWSRGKVELRDLLGDDGARKALGEDETHLWLTDEVSVEITS